MNVFVVTDDGYEHGWGAEIYLIGVFTDKDKAEKALKKTHRGKIKEIPMDKAFPLKKDTFDDYHNGFYLGGYAE